MNDLVVATTASSISLQINGSLLISQFGRISSDGEGHFGGVNGYHAANNSESNVTMSGWNGALGGGGGSHGGKGSDAPGGVSGGLPADTNVRFPLEGFGGGGGGAARIGVTGGRGGGIVNIRANIFENNGSISANGANGNACGAGGGAGGTVIIVASRCLFSSATSKITANGGNGLFSTLHFGGSGGGGRVSISCLYNANSLSSGYDSLTQKQIFGEISAFGGKHQYVNDLVDVLQSPQHLFTDLGMTTLEWLESHPDNSAASAGTVYLKTAELEALIIDNAGQATVTLPFSKEMLATDMIPTAEVMTSESFSLSYTSTHIHASLNVSMLSLNRHALVTLDKLVVVTVLQNLVNDGTSLLRIGQGAVLDISSHSQAFVNQNLAIMGTLITPQNVSLFASKIALGPMASWTTSYMKKKSFGEYHVSSLSLYNLSEIKVLGQNAPSGQIYSPPFSELQSINLVPHFYCDFLFVDVGSIISTSGSGHIAPLQGVMINSGNGGSHAGMGGGENILPYSTYGSSFSPVTWGAAGQSFYQWGGGGGGGLFRLPSQTRSH